MLRKLAAAGAAIGTLLVATLAQAQDKAGGFGEEGQFIFGADRLFSLFDYTSNTYTNNNVNPSQSLTITGTSMSFFYGTNTLAGSSNAGPLNGLGAGGNANFYTPPRLGFDYTIIPHLTIGGEVVALFTLGGSTTAAQGAQSVSNGSPTGNTFGLAPRVGYIIGMNDMISFWLRGGLSYYNATLSAADGACRNSSGTDSGNLWTFGLDLDPQVVISPIPHFAFMAGPALDWGFVGNFSSSQPNINNAGQCSGTTTTTLNYTTVNVGLTGGLLGWW